MKGPLGRPLSAFGVASLHFIQKGPRRNSNEKKHEGNTYGKWVHEPEDFAEQTREDHSQNEVAEHVGWSELVKQPLLCFVFHIERRGLRGADEKASDPQELMRSV